MFPAVKHEVTEMSVFETNIRFVGGLLSIYALTGDPLFRDRALHVARKLLPAFSTPTGIPYALINVGTGVSKNYAWASGGASILSEFGTLHLEFSYLSDITGDPVFKEKVTHVRDFIRKLDKPNGLYPNYLNPKTGKWGQSHSSMGALGDSFFEYLVKEWVQSDYTDTVARDMYLEAMKGVTSRMLQKSRGGLTYLAESKFDRLEHKMDHLACFTAGMFALGSHTIPSADPNHMTIAKELGHTCHESYARTSTGLGPESFRFSDGMEAKALKASEKYYILRPEVLEGWFYLWRYTKDQKYRDWAWDMVQSLERHCRVEGGFTGIQNVYLENSHKDDVQQSFLFAETLKYLYLIFSDDSLISLDEWVFNTEAHPIPVKNRNAFYRAAPAAVVADFSSRPRSVHHITPSSPSPLRVDFSKHHYSQRALFSWTLLPQYKPTAAGRANFSINKGEKVQTPSQSAVQKMNNFEQGVPFSRSHSLLPLSARRESIPRVSSKYPKSHHRLNPFQFSAPRYSQSPRISQAAPTIIRVPQSVVLSSPIRGRQLNVTISSTRVSGSVFSLPPYGQSRGRFLWDRFSPKVSQQSLDPTGHFVWKFDSI
ncbi:Glycoside hydrolase family 47 [Trinorchestia longiramus]|nr:Glycoside hydrolase family 47 [Trinorchestia longiramus]